MNTMQSIAMQCLKAVQQKQLTYYKSQTNTQGKILLCWHASMLYSKSYPFESSSECTGIRGVYSTFLHFTDCSIMHVQQIRKNHKGGIPLRQHSNMLHTTCLAFNKNYCMQLSTYVEFCCVQETLLLLVVCNTLC